MFLMLPSCQKEELNQDSMHNMDNLSTSPLSKPIKDKIKRGTVTDVAGNVYKTVLIGKQWWMAENLAYLPVVNLPTEESVTNPYYYVYDYIGEDVDAAKATDNYKTYGVLYNWTAAMAACPAGWHIPSDAEWTVGRRSGSRKQRENIYMGQKILGRSNTFIFSRWRLC
jgi:uncharacterized protein (TIGR02145 family)